jgi:hypothetical protein
MESIKMSSGRSACPFALLAVLIASSHACAGGDWPDPTSEWQQRGTTIDVVDNHGGLVSQYDALWARLGAEGRKVRVVGNCMSACTTLLGHVPRSRICVTPKAAFAFHRAQTDAHTAILWNDYPPDIQAWIVSRGGLAVDYTWLRPPELYRYFRRCGGGPAGVRR